MPARRRGLEPLLCAHLASIPDRRETAAGGAAAGRRVRRRGRAADVPHVRRRAARRALPARPVERELRMRLEDAEMCQTTLSLPVELVAGGDGAGGGDGAAVARRAAARELPARPRVRGRRGAPARDAALRPLVDVLGHVRRELRARRRRCRRRRRRRARRRDRALVVRARARARVPRRRARAARAAPRGGPVRARARGRPRPRARGAARSSGGTRTGARCSPRATRRRAARATRGRRTSRPRREWDAVVARLEDKADGAALLRRVFATHCCARAPHAVTLVDDGGRGARARARSRRSAPRRASRRSSRARAPASGARNVPRSP